MIIIKSPQEVERMKGANGLVAKTLKELSKMVEEGVTTLDLDRFAEDKVRKGGGIPAFKGYKGFPATLCTSVNEQVVHGIPSKRKLKKGDIVSVDLGVLLDGYYGDSAITFPVGKITDKAMALVKVTAESLEKGIEKAKEGNYLSDVSNAIQRHAEAEGFSVVRNFVGHGIGTSLHEEPQIPNFGRPGQGPRLKRGMVLAIEPMINEGGYEVDVLNDNWTVVTRDGKLSAHFEHTIAITNGNAEVLTARD